MPLYTNPAEFLLDLTSSDFALDGSGAQSRVEKLHSDWEVSSESDSLKTFIQTVTRDDDGIRSLSTSKSRASFSQVVIALLHRSFIKSYRDVVAYGIRFAMYLGQSVEGSPKIYSNTYRSCNYDGDGMASSTNDSELNSAVHQCNRKHDSQSFSRRR